MANDYIIEQKEAEYQEEIREQKMREAAILIIKCVF